MSRTVVVAPHPDDEVLGCSSVLYQSSTTVIHVTDGVPPWTVGPARDDLRSSRQSESPRAWDALSSQVDGIQLGFGDLSAWQAVNQISESLSEVIGSMGSTQVYLPAYQGGHPDHDATYLAGVLARDRLGERPGLVWSVYGLYGFDDARQLRFGWLPPGIYDAIHVEGTSAPLLEAKGRALRQFTSQVWPDSALDLWLRSPSGEQLAPLPARWERLPAWPSYYDEELGFGRHGASAGAVEAVFQHVLATTAR